MPVDLEVFDVRDAHRIALALAVRFEVFVREQNVPPQIEIDEHDRMDTSAVHVLARSDGEAIGAGRYYVRNVRTVQIGRMAVIRKARNQGLGRLLLGRLEHEAVTRGFAVARLHAQTSALRFYERCGYVAQGAYFIDAGIEHQAMEKRMT